MTPIGDLQPKLGDEVVFPYHHYNGSCGTVVVIDPSDSRQTYLIGWKHPMEGISSRVHIAASITPHFKIIHNYQSFVCSVWIHNETEVTLVQSKRGMKCAGRHCGTFNEYAIPNQPDGSHLCYSCRGKPDCLR